MLRGKVIKLPKCWNISGDADNLYSSTEPCEEFLNLIKMYNELLMALQKMIISRQHSTGQKPLLSFMQSQGRVAFFGVQYILGQTLFMVTLGRKRIWKRIIWIHWVESHSAQIKHIALQLSIQLTYFSTFLKSIKNIIPDSKCWDILTIVTSCKVGLIHFKWSIYWKWWDMYWLMTIQHQQLKNKKGVTTLPVSLLHGIW